MNLAKFSADKVNFDAEAINHPDFKGLFYGNWQKCLIVLMAMKGVIKNLFVRILIDCVITVGNILFKNKPEDYVIDENVDLGIVAVPEGSDEDESKNNGSMV